MSGLLCAISFHTAEKSGIYLHADRLLHHSQLIFQQTAYLRLWHFPTLLALIVYEVFQHEFYHHIVESTATHLEILLAAVGQNTAVYLQYHQRQLKDRLHPHHPLEEALANAYAYNSIGFLARKKQGYKDSCIEQFQEVMRFLWQGQSDGYRHAEHYIQNKHIAGNARLMELLLDQPGLSDAVPLSALVKHCMPRGYATFKGKPEIATYVYGSRGAVQELFRILPDLHATYTQLFWPYSYSKLDEQIKQEKAARKAAKKEATATQPNNKEQPLCSCNDKKPYMAA